MDANKIAKYVLYAMNSAKKRERALNDSRKLMENYFPFNIQVEWSSWNMYAIWVSVGAARKGENSRQNICKIFLISFFRALIFVHLFSLLLAVSLNVAF